MFYGRKKELQFLKSQLESENGEVGFVYGQRRIGKTSLVLESLKERKCLYFLASDTTELANRTLFSASLNGYLGLPKDYVYPSFADIFASLEQVAEKEKLFLFIDELPFLAKTYPAIMTLLQGFIDNVKPKGAKIIFSGSDIAFIKSLLKDKSAPLYKRETFQLEVRQLPFSEAKEMLQGFPKDDIIPYISLFGGRPLYLSMLEKYVGFYENVKRLLFSIGGGLVDAPMITLPTTWGNNGVYTAIYEAIASRKRKVKEISEATGIPSNNLSTYLEKLLEAEILVKKESFNGSLKGNYYDFNDPLLGFYYLFVFPYVDLIRRGAGQAVFEEQKERIDLYISKAFEHAVIQYMDERNVEGKLGALYQPFKSFRADNSPLKRSIEIDAMAEGVFDSKKLLVIEAKYREKNLSLSVLEHLKESVSIFPKYKEIDYYLFSKTGFSDDIKAVQDDHVHLVSLEDMLR